MNNQGKIKNLLLQGKTPDEVLSQLKKEMNLNRPDQINALKDLIEKNVKEFKKEQKELEKDPETIIRTLEAKVNGLEIENKNLKDDIKFLLVYLPFLEAVIGISNEKLVPMLKKESVEKMIKRLEELKNRMKNV